PYGLIKLGKLYASVDRYEEAIGAYSMAIDLEPKEHGFNYYRGIAWFHMGNMEQAMSDFAIALEAEPWNKVEILNFTGCIKYRTGDFNGASADLNEVLNKNHGLLNDLILRPDEYEDLQNNCN
ncbi:MAG: tetratricopeptide repeat protein, partial [Flavobacteriales bacterium]